jgi:hypothetical protein
MPYIDLQSALIVINLVSPTAESIAHSERGDLLDAETGEFLSTDRRRELLKDSPLVSAPVLWRGLGRSVEHLQSLVRRSRYKTEAWRDRLLT